MAEKRKSPPESETQTNLPITGYLMNVSPVLTSSSGTTKYFTAVLQTGKSESRRLVSFSPEKHPQFVRTAQQDSPIKLTNAKLQVGRTGELEITANRSTQIEVTPEKLTFKKRLVMEESARPTTYTLQQLTKENMVATVNVKIIGFVDNKTAVQTKYGTRYVRKAVVGDRTKNMMMSFWADKSDEVKSNSSYQATPVVVRLFDGSLVLNTTSTTKFTCIPEIEDVKDDINDLLEEKTETVYVKQVSINKTQRCQACHHKLDVAAEEPTVRCTACKVKQRISELKKSTYTVITIVDSDNNEGKYTVAENVMITYLQSNNKQDLMEDVDRLEDFLLEKNHLKITRTPNSETIRKIQD